METNNTKNQIGSPKYWLSLEQWRNDADFQKMAEQEFQSSPLSEDNQEEGTARRDFLKLMGASMALASFGCVRRPAQKIIPYANRPDYITPGLPNYYASSLVDGEEGFGIVVTTREGRPVMLAGHNDHPANQGKMSARAHAHILSLYDPDRLSAPKKNLLNAKKTNRDVLAITWDNLDKEVSSVLNQGKVALLMGSNKSPSRKKLVEDFQSAFSARVYNWSPADYGVMKTANQMSFGKNVIPSYDIENAKMIVSVGADFLGTFLAPTEFNKKFSKMRKPEKGDMSRLLVFESGLSLTGSNADQRFQLQSSSYFTLLMTMAAKLGAKAGVNVPRASQYKTVDTLGIDNATFDHVVEELWKNKGQAVVLSGVVNNEDALAIQLATNLINSILQADKSIINFDNHYLGFEASNSDIHQLIQDANAGKIDTLLIYGVNPGYALPESAGFRESLLKVKQAVYFGDRNDETGSLCDYVATTHNELENWGDAEFKKGVYSIQQPTIRPLYDTRSFEDSLIAFMKTSGKSVSSESWFDYLKSNWKSSIASSASVKGFAGLSFEDFWIKLLQTGVFNTATSSVNRSSLSMNDVSQFLAAKQQSSELELDLYFTSGLADGHLANVSWLQEFPDPVTKICWDNYLSVSPDYADKNKLSEGQDVEVSVANSKIKVPVHIQPGQNNKTVSLALGYGRTMAGEVANGVGVNAYQAAVVKNGFTLTSSLPVSVKKLSTKTPIANVQGHHSMEGRQIVVEATLDQYKKSADAGIHKHKIFSLWDKHKYSSYKWGMTIDLSACTGCSACVVACQSENNIPTVGKKYVLQGRIMSWVRVDRYYTGTPQDPDSVFMPIVCQHCDNAPCETVCPVVATVHSDEGTNDMIYNRCVGTRYCANNCPYKVRRFNWFDYTKLRSPLHMALNPEVTVRDRGVMEKCTFCKHRSTFKKSQAKLENRKLRTDEVTSACQDSCPTDAITFGDLNDPHSAVAQSFISKRGYSLLEELNNQPAIRYQTKIRNTKEIKSHGGDSHHENNNHKENKEGHHS